MAAYESAEQRRADCIVAENELSLATQAEKFSILRIVIN